MALTLFRTASQISCGLGSWVALQMLINIFFDYVVGLVPFLGDLADAAFKANAKNCRLLEQRLDQVYRPKEKSKRSKTGPNLDPHSQLPAPTSPATVYEAFSDDELETGVMTERGHEPHRHESRRHEPRRPEPAYTQSDHPVRGSRWSWVGGKKHRQPDEEMGQRRP
jgi:hypothetical protein